MVPWLVRGGGVNFMVYDAAERLREMSDNVTR